MKIHGLLLITVLILGLVGCSQIDKASKNSEKSPNVIVIFMDDMGYGDLSSFGHPTISTPNIDKLAREGQKWTNFYTACSVCSPSRGALLTGRYPVRIGLGPTQDNKRVFFPNSTGGLPSNEITIAEMLKEKGYKTGIIGKWHLGHLPEHLPTTQGFDSYYGIPYSNDMDAVGGWKLSSFFVEPDHNMWNVPLMANTEIIERPANQHTITKRYTEKALEFIEANKDDPFFLYFPHSMVHTPLFAHQDFLDTSPRGLYGDVMAEVDWSVGQVISKLEDLDLDKNTLVVFTSDNGPWLVMRETGGSSGLLADGKGTTWEGGMRVPGIFYMPGTVQPGAITGLGSTLDLLPTIASMTGADLPKERTLDGYDLTSVLTKKSDSPRDHMIYYRLQDIYAVRKGDYKAHYITETCYTLDNGRKELENPLLYNLNHDPSEKYDHAKDHPEILEEIAALVQDHEAGMKVAESELDKFSDVDTNAPDRERE